MKRIYYILFLASMVLVSAASVSAQNQDAKSMNKKNLVVKEWNTKAKSNQKVLDHITRYNSQGQKVEEIEYNSNKQKWRKRYERGSNGKIVKELTYNDANNLVSIKKFEYNEFDKKKVQYTYDAKGRLLTIKTFEYTTE